jgi:hypothetical protein
MLAVKLLGQFEVRLDEIVIDIPSRTEQSLLAFLITNSGTSFCREQLAGVAFSEIEPLVIPGAHQGSINKFSFNQDSSLLATAGLGGIAEVWRLKDTGAELLMNLSGH